MDIRTKNRLVALVIGIVAVSVYLLSVAKFFFSANTP